jgi:hypothetical protein
VNIPDWRGGAEFTGATGEEVGNRSAWNRLVDNTFGVPQQSREYRRGKLRMIALSRYVSARKLVSVGKMPVFVVELKRWHQEGNRDPD